MAADTSIQARKARREEIVKLIKTPVDGESLESESQRKYWLEKELDQINSALWVQCPDERPRIPTDPKELETTLDYARERASRLYNNLQHIIERSGYRRSGAERADFHSGKSSGDPDIEAATTKWRQQQTIVEELEHELHEAKIEWASWLRGR